MDLTGRETAQAKKDVAYTRQIFVREGTAALKA